MSISETNERRLAREARERLAEHGRRSEEAADFAVQARRKADQAGERQRERDAAAISKLHALRYPDGMSEFRTAPAAPEVGSTLKRDGDSWEVIDVRQEKDGTSTVTLRPELASCI